MELSVGIGDSDDFHRAARALREAAEGSLQDRIASAIAERGAPIGIWVRDRGAESMPGGVAALVREASFRTEKSARGGDFSVTVEINSSGVNIAQLDAGVLHHPVFGRPDSMVEQDVPSGSFSRAFEAETRTVEAAARKGADRALEDVARKV